MELALYAGCVVTGMEYVATKYKIKHFPWQQKVNHKLLQSQSSHTQQAFPSVQFSLVNRNIPCTGYIPPLKLSWNTFRCSASKTPIMCSVLSVLFISNRLQKHFSVVVPLHVLFLSLFGKAQLVSVVSPLRCIS